MNLKHKAIIRLSLDRDEYLENKSQSFNNSLSLVVHCNVQYHCSGTGLVKVGSDCSV